MTEPRETDVDEFVAALMAAHRPARRPVEWPAHVTAAARRGGAPAPAPVPGPRLRWRLPTTRRGRLAAIGSAVTVILVAGGFIVLPTTVANAAPPATPANIIGIALTGINAKDYLQNLAGRVEALDEAPTPGYYTHTRVQMWNIDVDWKHEDADKKVISRDVQLWWAPKQNRIRQETILPQSPHSTRATSCDELPTEKAHPRDRRELGEQDISLLIDGTPATDPDRLLTQLTGDQAPPGPLVTVGLLADLHRFHTFDPRQRAAVLRLVARASGLEYHGHVTDRCGRVGIAVSVHDDYTRRALIFDEVTGKLLDAETITLVDRNEPTVTADSVVAYTLYLDNRTTDQTS